MIKIYLNHKQNDIILQVKNNISYLYILKNYKLIHDRSCRRAHFYNYTAQCENTLSDTP